MLTKIDVVQIKYGPFAGLFAVQLMELPGSDEMWDTWTHAARFSSAAQAERLARRVRTALDRGNSIDLKGCWTWDVSVCSPFAIMHERPTAVPFLVASAEVAS